MTTATTTANTTTTTTTAPHTPNTRPFPRPPPIHNSLLAFLHAHTAQHALDLKCHAVACPAEPAAHLAVVAPAAILAEAALHLQKDALHTTTPSRNNNYLHTFYVLTNKDASGPSISVSTRNENTCS